MTAEAGSRRDPDRTRDALLEAAFHEIHVQGFRSASLDDILKRTGVTRGALYHHFPNKTELGYAVIEEVIRPWGEQKWARLLDVESDPIDALKQILGDIVHDTCVCDGHLLALGCPVNNLAQEMAPIDEGFRRRIERIFTDWREAIERALRRGQESGQVRTDINIRETSLFIVAAYEGCVGLGKSSHSERVFKQSLNGLAAYLDSLRSDTTT